MNERTVDSKRPSGNFIKAHSDDLDYLQSGIETKLPDDDTDGICGVLELASSRDRQDTEFLDTQGRRLIVLDIQKARKGRLAEFLAGLDETETPEHSIALLDIRALQKTEGGPGFEKGILILSPGEDPYLLGRGADETKQAFGWDEHQAGGISSRHLDIRVTDHGVFARDRKSMNQTILATGKYAQESIMASPEHHEHVAHIKQLLGEEAVEEVIAPPEEASESPEADASIVTKPSNTKHIEAMAESEKSQNTVTAEARVAAIIGKDSLGGGHLGEKLRLAGSSPDEIVKALAESSDNQELRDEILNTLRVRMTQLLDQGGQFHERVQRNDPDNKKSVPLGFNYKREKYTSDEYVCLLALAKLDGSFDIKLATQGISDLPADDIHAGQHRQAADTLLESFAKEQSGPEIEIPPSDEFLREIHHAVIELSAQLGDNFRLSSEKMEEILTLVKMPMFNTQDIEWRITEVAAVYSDAHAKINNTQRKIRNAKHMIDTENGSNAKLDEQIEMIDTQIHRANETLRTNEYRGGLDMINHMNSDLAYDSNMLLEFRSRVPQVIHTMRQTEQTVLSIITNIEVPDKY